MTIIVENGALQLMQNFQIMFIEALKFEIHSQMRIQLPYTFICLLGNLHFSILLSVIRIFKPQPMFLYCLAMLAEM